MRPGEEAQIEQRIAAAPVLPMTEAVNVPGSNSGDLVDEGGGEETNAGWAGATQTWPKESRSVDGGSCAARSPNPHPAIGNIIHATC
jgi:hypothetical protein